MFTGIITDIGRIEAVDERVDWRVRIGCGYDLSTVGLGASIACSGVCLTVVDMAGDDVAAELVADLKRTFEIEEAPLLPHAGRGAAPCLGGNIDREPLLAFVDDRQADARTGDRGAEIDPRHVVGAGDPRAQVAALLDGLDPADIGDYACEHCRRS